MTKDVLSWLQIVGLRETPTILQLAESSTIKPNGMIEDIKIILNSWEYLADFCFLSLKYNMRGYILNLCRPWLSTADAYIARRSWKMTISNGFHTKNLTLYSLAQPLLLDEQPIWLDLGDGDPKANTIHHLMMITRELFIANWEEDEIISSIILNEYGIESPISP